MYNVVHLDDERSRRPAIKNGLSALLADLARRVARLSELPMATKEQMQQRIFIIELSNVRMQQLISGIQDYEVRTRLIAHSERIRGLIETAKLKASEL